MWPRTKKAYQQYIDAVAEFMGDNEIENITTEGEAYVSSHGCDSCGSPDQQLVYDAVAVTEHGEYLEFQVCEDCSYYLEYGKLDDAQMDEIDAWPGKHV